MYSCVLKTLHSSFPNLPRDVHDWKFELIFVLVGITQVVSVKHLSSFRCKNNCTYTVITCHMFSLSSYFCI